MKQIIVKIDQKSIKTVKQFASSKIIISTRCTFTTAYKLPEQYDRYLVFFQINSTLSDTYLYEVLHGMAQEFTKYSGDLNIENEYADIVSAFSNPKYSFKHADTGWFSCPYCGNQAYLESYEGKVYGYYEEFSDPDSCPKCGKEVEIVYDGISISPPLRGFPATLIDDLEDVGN